MSDIKNDKAKIDLGLLEEDDEFEEFPAEGTYENKYVMSEIAVKFFFSVPRKYIF